MEPHEKHYLKLNDIGAYKIAFKFSNSVWGVVAEWDHFAKGTLGRQFCRAADSISANLAEGFGRYHKREKVQFYRIALGSVWECLDCNEKARKRALLSEIQYKTFYQTLSDLPRAIHQLIKFTNDRLEK